MGGGGLFPPKVCMLFFNGMCLSNIITSIKELLFIPVCAFVFLFTPLYACLSVISLKVMAIKVLGKMDMIK